MDTGNSPASGMVVRHPKCIYFSAMFVNLKSAVEGGHVSAVRTRAKARDYMFRATAKITAQNVGAVLIYITDVSP